MWIIRRLCSGIFWGLLIFVILDGLVPFVPLGSLVIFIGLFYTKFMRGWARLLLKYCDAVEGIAAEAKSNESKNQGSWTPIREKRGRGKGGEFEGHKDIKDDFKKRYRKL